jgi:heme A synthase
MDFGLAATECCAKAVEVANQCLVGSCLTWSEYTTIIEEVWTAYKGEYKFVPTDYFDSFGGSMTALSTLFVIWSGMNWTGDTLSGALPVYWPTVGATASIIVGSLSGLYVATVAIYSAYNNDHNQDSYWNPTGMSERIAFNQAWGGIMYNTVRAFETLSTMLYIALGIALAGMPYWISLKLEAYID